MCELSDNMALKLLQYIYWSSFVKLKLFGTNLSYGNGLMNGHKGGRTEARAYLSFRSIK